MTEVILSQVQAAEPGCLRRVHVATLRDKVRSCEIRRALNVELLSPPNREIPCYVGSAMCPDKSCWLNHGKAALNRPRTRWSDYISDLTWYRLVVESTELPETAVDCEVFRIVLGLLPRDPPPEKRA